ncbi:conserved hypothetical protein [Xanthomonas citri pv. fuscans]|nr:conserved hypothetical protein [Xanthomonas citri pv. fuscans]SON97572.1 conserved hypothetical protein [Xanthomonas citri pv. fuscans]SON99425.1 conserved hypothetical protein [Xanthomonas citri pv. fuscans]SOO43255.1 conserved hypothetical protein [Xanthomonas citri pv. fuscans]
MRRCGVASASIDAVQIAQLRLPSTEVRCQVGDVLIAQRGGLGGHQRMLTVAATVGLQRMRKVVAVLAAQLGIAGIDRRIAIGTVAVHAALAGRLALGMGELVAGVGAAGGQTCRRAGAVLAAGVTGIASGVVGGLNLGLGAGRHHQGSDQGDG